MKIQSSVFVALGLTLLWSPPALCAVTYKADAIEGWVVDAGTDSPLEGVIVVAHWQLRGGIEGGTPIRELKILESVTDQNGRYSFPSWGPEFALTGALESESPAILMFKQGYKFQRLMNQWRPDLDTSKSEWNGKTVKLVRFTGTLKQYAEHLSGLNSDLWIVGHAVGEYSGDPCGWRSFPNMLRAMDKFDEEIKPLRLWDNTVAAQLRANDSKLRSAGCGSVADFLGK